MSAPYYSDDLVTLYHGDCRDVLPGLDPASVDLVLTDPPYPAEFQHLYGEMARAATPAMKIGASLVSLCGHYQVPAVLDAFTAAGLRYWWLAGMSHDSISRLPGKWVSIRWKPAVWFVKERRRPGDSHAPMDMMRGGSTALAGDKQFHKWGQPASWFVHWIDQLAPDPEHVVLDPFVGGGATLAAAKLLGRQAIGVEIDERHCETTAKRLAQDALPFENGAA